ncbi:MAG: DUF3021 domain-containing protein [Lachnospiraceae bacterium]|nr:DUF3021 domain-containing protein [Lachnospiraceae bacterium]
MLKNALIRMTNSFMYAIGITAVIYFFITVGRDFVPLLPEYRERFDNDTQALIVQLMLIGCMSAALGGGSVIMEMERLSLLAQSIIYFVLASVVWISVGCYCWCIYKYPQALASTIISYVGSYVICWVIQYKLCKKNIEKINRHLQELEEKRVA